MLDIKFYCMYKWHENSFVVKNCDVENLEIIDTL